MSKDEKENYLFLGFALPDEEMYKAFSKDNSPQVQTHKFNWNLIKGLEYSNSFNFTYISSRAVNEYPVFPERYIKRNDWNIEIDNKKIEVQEIPYVNIGILKLITRFFASLYYSFKKFHLRPNKAGIIIYSVHVPYMFVGLIISRIYNIDYVAIWTDPPAVNTKRDSLLKTLLRRTELRLSKYLMRKATKVISLTKYLAEDFAPGKPYLVMEGIINRFDVNTDIKRKINSSKQVKIVYTGALEVKYGIKNIVDGFLLLKDKNLVFEIYGRGDFEDELVKITQKNLNVIYKGFVPNNQILKIQREADFLINARSSEEDFVKYSFPSKTLEYMLSGTPLITTMLPGIPEEYKTYVISLENNTPEVIAEKLRECLQYSDAYLNSIGIEAQKFALSKNYINQGKNLIDFLKEGNENAIKHEI